MSLAQIGEFAFVLLSRASNLHLVGVSAYFFNLLILSFLEHLLNFILLLKKWGFGVANAKLVILFLFCYPPMFSTDLPSLAWHNGCNSLLQGKVYLLLLGTTALSLVSLVTWHFFKLKSQRFWPIKRIGVYGVFYILAVCCCEFLRDIYVSCYDESMGSGNIVYFSDCFILPLFH